MLLDVHAFNAVMDDGCRQAFSDDDLAADHLAHGYAVTVHRSQGDSVDTAHLFADEGDRELGYVGMSRARHAAIVVRAVQLLFEGTASASTIEGAC